MTYRIDVPSLIASGVQRSVTDELSAALRAYVHERTTDVTELRKKVTAVLERLPQPAMTPEHDEVTIQAELLGAFMRIAHMTSPFYNRFWTSLGWNGTAGLSADSAIFRHRITLQTLLTVDWIGDLSTTTQNHYCRTGGRFCCIGHPLSLSHQWQVFRDEYKLPARVDCLVLRLNRGGFGDITVERDERDVTDAYPPRVVTVVTMTGAKQSDAEYLPSLLELQNSSAFDVLLADADTVVRLSQLLEGTRWSGRPFRVVLVNEPVPADARRELRFRRFCDYVVERVEGVGAVPALMQCKFERLHGFPWLQRAEQVDELLITDLFSFSCPVFRVPTQLNVRQVNAPQCCCGRFDMYVWEQ